MKRLISQWIEMPITNEAILWSLTKSVSDFESLEGSSLKSRFNTNWWENNVLGNLGEFLFNDWMKTKDVPYLWDNDKSGQSDEFDFYINNKKVDVKSSLRKLPLSQLKNNYGLLVHKNQLGSHADYYAWVLFQGSSALLANNAYLVGFLSAERVGSYPELASSLPGAKAFSVPFGDVIPPSEILNVVRE